MEEVFRVVTVTPIRMGNANSDPELRPPAVRASARYWLRAVAGAVIGDSNTNQIFDLESAVFGNAKSGSPISMRIPQQQIQPVRTNFLPHKPQPVYRDAFPTGTAFDIVFSGRVVPSEIWDIALAVFRLSIMCGGLGLRARRGFGTLSITGETPATEASWNVYIPKLFNDALVAVQNYVTSKGGHVLPAPPIGPCRFPCGSTQSIIKLSQPPKKWGDSLDALNGIMQTIHARGIKENIDYLGDEIPRKASPLWVRVVQVASDEFRLLLISLPSIQISGYLNLINFLRSDFPGGDFLIKGWNS